MMVALLKKIQPPKICKAYQYCFAKHRWFSGVIFSSTEMDLVSLPCMVHHNADEEEVGGTGQPPPLHCKSSVLVWEGLTEIFLLRPETGEV
jgi:hypothetical protein